jgi:Fic family protein
MNVKIPVDHELLRLIALVDQYRGAWEAGAAVPLQRADALRTAATVNSTAASCRLAGFRVSDADVRMLLEDPETPLLSGREILGYARALDWAPFDDEPALSAGLLGRLHALVAGGATEDPPPSGYREEPLLREAFADGSATGRVFSALPPRMVPQAVENLVTWAELELADHRNHPLLVAGAFSLAALAISPYAKASGRWARVVTVRLLRRSGYAFLPFGSLESQIERTRARYHEAFDASETRLWTGEADLRPWLTYFLEVLGEVVGAVRGAIEVEAATQRYSPLQLKVIETLRVHGTADAALLLEATGANRNTLKDNMRRLVGFGVVEKMGERRGTRYRLGSAAGALLPDPD